MKIGVVGVGMVGGTIKHGFEYIGHTVIPHDLKMDTNIRDTFYAEMVFVCVPTPSNEDGSCDTTLVQKVIGELSGYEGLIVIKSTVTPGTTSRLIDNNPKLHIAFCPEFLREKTAYTDFIDNHEVCVAGVISNDDADMIREAHGRLPKHFAVMSPLEAELCKYFSNTLNALRIVFANEFYDVCDAAGADYQVIKNAMIKRSSVGTQYLERNEVFRGFGGKCLPKDTDAFAVYANHLGFDRSLFQFICWANDRIKGQK